MKCDELEQVENPIEWGLYYDKEKVDSAIAELKAEINRKEAVGQRWFARCMEARAENVKLKRALWLARAKSAENAVTNWCPECMKKWNEVERKCRAKAEEYR